MLPETDGVRHFPVWSVTIFLVIGMKPGYTSFVQTFCGVWTICSTMVGAIGGVVFVLTGGGGDTMCSRLMPHQRRLLYIAPLEIFSQPL